MSNENDSEIVNIFDIDNPPKRTEYMTAHAQVWVWLNGPGLPHWEIRGMGLVL